MMSNWCKKGVSMTFNCCLISENIVLAKHLFAWSTRHAWSHFLRVFLGAKRLQERRAYWDCSQFLSQLHQVIKTKSPPRNLYIHQ